MYFIPYFGVGISLAGMAYLVFRALPRIKNLRPDIVVPELGIGRVALRLKDYWRTLQPALMAFLARVLHRSRIMTLKTDNRLSQWLEKIRNRSRLVSARSRTWFLERRLAPKIQPRISFAALAEEKWKQQEEELLNRIKEHPREAGLYRELADLYEKMGNAADANEARLTAEKLTANPPSRRTRKTTTQS